MRQPTLSQTPSNYANEPPKRRRKLGSNEILPIGAEVMCKWSGNNEEYPAKVLKRRDDPIKSGQYQLYVRYQGFDHRLDEWVNTNRITAVLVPTTTTTTTTPSSSALILPTPTTTTTTTTSTSSRSNHYQKNNNGSNHFTSSSNTNNNELLNGNSGPPLRSLSRMSSNGSSDDEGQVKNIHTIELGRFEIDTWYFSPYPEEYCKESKLYICEFCLKYVKKKHTLERHAQKCECTSPPGMEIYREGELSVFEVDGKKHRTYCQNLCLLSKLFLDHKTLYYDVDPFLFYILCECDAAGAHIVGYFSKEKYSPDNYNLACILTLPPYQRKGYGSFLISLSYELSKRTGVTGSPEKPLSDLGRLGYHSYWSRVILELINNHKGESLSIREISKLTGITVEDVVETLRALKLVRFWRGQHVLIVSQNLVTSFLNSQSSKKFRVINPKLLNWSPKKT
jgi:histone acetyltransferase MYST1